MLNIEKGLRGPVVYKRCYAETPVERDAVAGGSGEGGKLEGLCAPSLRHSESPSPQLLFTGVKETLVQPLHYEWET